MPCRYNRRRVWSNRIMFEALQHEHNAFVTLTYSDDQLPAGNSLDPVHLKKWLWRLRTRLAPDRIRFFAVGEYGDETQRPHYHAALFGFGSCLRGQSQFSRRSNSCCPMCDLVRDTWGHGNVFLGALEPHSAQYVCGYVVKKMTAKDDPRLEGRHPEFARMSLKPGIGRDAMFEVADTLMRHGLDVSRLDVPTMMSVGGIDKPLGRYLVQSLRRMVGKDEKAPPEVIAKFVEEVRALQIAAKNSTDNPSLKGQILAANKGKFQRFEAKSKIYKERKSI